MIHMTANLPVSVFWIEAGWSAYGGQKVSKESSALSGAFSSTSALSIIVI
jgi:hypothetical protein